ncbi:transporter [Halarchaeum sp. CBA1220]|uniref:transporter n=1 Tax=Halarchaeum sp. CBA1220 TaxID=1853682 RepID=UPI000F3AA53B|nr:transporter [Halarchaeum sp. CBA1220]QLC32806.1 transporter [Halarchaeum sp. CBA1220]
MSASSTGRDVPWVPAAAVGIAAYVLQYLVVYLWQANRVRDQLSGLNAVIEFLGGQAIPAWQAVGWLFYNAHFVSFTYPSFGGGRTATNLIASGNAPQLLYVLPPLFLLVGGYLLVRSVSLADPTDGALCGTVLSLGYAVPAWFGVFAFRITTESNWLGPDLVTGIVLAGVVYPVVFGAIGGAVAAATSD